MFKVQMTVRGRWETIPAYAKLSRDEAEMVCKALQNGSNAIQYRVR